MGVTLNKAHNSSTLLATTTKQFVAVRGMHYALGQKFSTPFQVEKSNLKSILKVYPGSIGSLCFIVHTVLTWS